MTEEPVKQAPLRPPNSRRTKILTRARRRNNTKILLHADLAVLCNGPEVAVFQSHPKLVNRVCDDDTHICGHLGDIRNTVLNSFSTRFINLDRGNVRIRQRGYNLFQIRNVFLGPFYF